MAKYLSRRDIDWTLLLMALLICAVGVLQIYSATRDTGYTTAWWKQVIYIGGGLFLINREMMSILLVDHRGRFMLGVAILNLFAGMGVMAWMIKRALR